MEKYYAYILLSRSQTIVSKAIYYFTRNEFTHSSLSLEPDLDTMYSFCRIYAPFTLPAGFSQESLYRGFYKMHPSIPCSLYKVEVDKKTYDMLQCTLDRLMEKKDYLKYDLANANKWRKQIVHRRTNYRYCSWFVAELLQAFHVLSFDKDVSIVRPVDFMECKEVTHVYKGKIADLREFLNKGDN